jgi:hypothetical protein
MQVEPTCTTSNTRTKKVFSVPPKLPIERIVQFEVCTETNPSCKTTQPLAEELSLRMANEVLRSIMQRRFRESSKQDFAVLSELAEVCDDDCKYQLLLVRLRRKLPVLSGESSPRYHLKFVYKYKDLFLRRFGPSQSSTQRTETSRPEPTPCSYHQSIRTP